MYYFLFYIYITPVATFLAQDISANSKSDIDCPPPTFLTTPCRNLCLGPPAARMLSNEFKRQEQPGPPVMSGIAALVDDSSAVAAAHWGGSTPTIRCDTADVIRIDVGGAVFKTRRATLTSVPGSLLSSMFARSPATVFIDRDPRWFELIVTWLRDRQAPSHWPMNDPAWVHEVEHFGLTQAMFGEGCLYIIGGEDDDGPFGAGELYDPVRCEWREVSEMPIRRDAHAAVRHCRLVAIPHVICILPQDTGDRGFLFYFLRRVYCS